MTLITLQLSTLRELAQEAARDFLNHETQRAGIVRSIKHFDNPQFTRLVQVYLHEAARSQAYAQLRRN